ncbi:hypothetical protein BJY01DRAFT_247666 [Aspergillus pseudoustus]|uniref:Zn(2)-C6 fungal-type domain-containing protein n=1 Tax=Aspergillus pseudoustus TaxID=1810923 RepID=A0ABR4JZL6_9EURO
METSTEPASARVGCIVCRSRKVRCDKSLPSCRNCARLSVPCPGYSKGHGSLSRKEVLKLTESIFQAAGKEKRRIGACQACRISKEQCSRTRPSCRRCATRRLDCVYRPVEPLRAQTNDSPARHTGLGTIRAAGLEIPLSALSSETLPSAPTSRCLINTYFERINPMGCMSIIHKPSFMHALDRDTVLDDFGESTVLIFLDSVRSQGTTAAENYIPGGIWAEQARKHVLLAAHTPTTQDLMAMVLLCDYAMRTNQHSLIFILAGCLFRAIRLLGLDTPKQQTPQKGQGLARQETENRIVWAAYHIDMMIASGVDKHSSWRDDFPRIPLPLSNQDFLTLSAGSLYYLDPIDQLSDSRAIRALDLPALITVLIRLRGTVLRIIRTTPEEGTQIWNAFAPFMTTLQKLKFFYSNIPDRFRLTDLNMYMHKDQHTLGAVFFLHLLFHAAMFDLTRISLPGFSFPLATGFQDAPTVFVQDCQKRCRSHAHGISNLVRTAASHRDITLDQPGWGDIVFESSKIQIVHAATVGNDPDSQQTARQNLRAHLELLEFLYNGGEERSPYIRVILSLCMLFGFQDIAREWRGAPAEPDDSTYVTGSSDMHHLSHFASFRQAKAEVQSRQTNTGPSTTAQASPQSRPGRSAKPQSKSSKSWTTPHGGDNPEKNDPITESLPLPTPREQVLQTPVSAYNEMEPSVEDYIRTAEDMCDYLAWDSIDSWQLWEWPPWDAIDPQNGS